jgi:hypothetical protein
MSEYPYSAAAYRAAYERLRRPLELTETDFLVLRSFDPHDEERAREKQRHAQITMVERREKAALKAAPKPAAPKPAAAVLTTAHLPGLAEAIVGAFQEVIPPLYQRLKALEKKNEELAARLLECEATINARSNVGGA